MSRTKPHQHILVTRPSPYGEQLCQQLIQHGYPALHCPVMQVSPQHTTSTQLEQWQQLQQYQWLIFVSQFAVQYGLELLAALRLTIPDKINIATVGPSSAALLRAAGYSKIVYPETTWGSSALLALPALSTVASAKVAIVCGTQYNQELINNLHQQNAAVQCLPVYTTTTHTGLAVAPIQALLDQQRIRAITCTSAHIISHLLALFRPASIMHIPLLVGSDNIQQAALKKGFTHCVLLANNGGEAIIKGLLTMSQHQQY